MAEAPLRCDTHPELTSFQYPLPHLMRSLNGRRRTRVVAIGSSSTAGEGDLVPYPARLELLLRKSDLAAAVKALCAAHPYEEPAFDCYPVLNQGETVGLGRIGRLADAVTLGEFAFVVKERLKAGALRMVGDPGRPVRKIALCSGSGASLLREAAWQGADVLVTGDVKYHEARDAEALGVALVDAGHFATERIMAEAVADRLRIALAAGSYDVSVAPFTDDNDPFTAW